MKVSIEDILAMDDTHRETVTIPEWNNAEVLVVSMTADERSEMEKTWYKKDAASDPKAFRLDMLRRTAKKDDGVTPFGTPEQFAALMGKNANAVERLFDAGCKLSAWSKKDVEEITKN